MIRVISLRVRDRLYGWRPKSSQSFRQSSSNWIVGAAVFPPLLVCQTYKLNIRLEKGVHRTLPGDLKIGTTLGMGLKTVVDAMSHEDCMHELRTRVS